ncbi:hypothetical protein [Aliikangiella coralliicola]|uniref:Uncharacterized protein n=1 Tax=Aliikangiella coralliicola TaxID=2592383 RepID=A0A545U7C8_9GAMM|nr:hypothetical protein [Aliikangiella coralliicola]TQV85313.1 hypothetical protein FLL46_19290 [Aliikangiella coralliicola]
MKDHISELQKLLKDARDVTCVSAEYLMTLLMCFEDEKQKHLIYSLCCNFSRLGHNFELQLLKLGIDTFGKPYDPEAFKNTSYADVDIVETMRQYLENEKEASLVH